MKQEQTILLGFTKDHAVVFADVRLYEDGCFSASFDESSPFEATQEFLEQQAESLIDCMEKDWVLDQLEKHDCKPSELTETIASVWEVNELVDISLHDEEYQIEGLEHSVYFMASGCGQHDTRDDMETYVNRELFDKIHELWDEYHLKEIPEDKWKELQKMIDRHRDEVDETQYITNYLETKWKEER